MARLRGTLNLNRTFTTLIEKNSRPIKEIRGLLFFFHYLEVGNDLEAVAIRLLWGSPFPPRALIII